MRRTAIMTAVAAGFAGSAGSAAAQSEVTIYGTLLPFFENIRTKDATPPGLSPAAGGATQVPAAAYTGINSPSRNRMTSGTSNIGFRGAEDLGNGLKAIFQFEFAASVDGDPPNFTARNSHVGLAGSWGTLSFGVWDTPYKWTTLAVAPLRGLNPFDYDNILENPGFAVPGTTTQSGRVNGAADAAFSRRQGNSVQYWSPTLAGFSARLAYSANEGKTSATPTAPSISPDLWSASLSYDNGPLTLRYAFERHDDYFGMAQLGGSAGATATNSESTDTGHKLVAILKIGDAKLSAVYERLKYDAEDSAAGAVNEYERDAFHLQVQQRFGASQVWAAFGKAREGDCERVGGASCVTDGLGAKQWTLGYAYSMSKRTDLYAAYYGVDNDRSARYGAFPPVGTTAPGADTRGLGVGILHSF